MSDRLKFRVWDKERKCFFNNDEVVIYPNGEESFFNADYDFTECVVEQCTGLMDKNGRLIYEGDIVKNIEQRIRVVFDEQRYCFMFEYQNTRAYKPISCIDVLDDELEIIGNIHENPELVEQSNDN